LIKVFIFSVLLFFIFYGINFSYTFGQNNKSISNLTDTIENQPIQPTKNRLIVTTELNKHKFIPFETVIISGKINEFNLKNSTVKPHNGQLFVNIYELDKSKAKSLPGMLSELYEYGNKVNGSLIYTKEIFTNGSFNIRFETPDPRISGQYVIVYSPAANPNLDPFFEYTLGHFDYFEVVPPWKTLWGWMFFISGIFGIGLIILTLKSGRIDSFISFEILRFVCISGIILPIIIGLLFIDSEWGTNSPISIIKLYGIKTQEQLTNQWVIAIGGVRTDNYQSGVFIPIYVVIFGLIGGYLRYLYRTMIQRVNFEDEEEVDVLIFNWNEVPMNALESNKLKQYLLANFDVHWISQRNFVRGNDSEISMTSENGENLLLLRLNDKKNRVDLIINSNKTRNFVAKKLTDKILIYQTIDKKRWIFYQSLGDLTILFMAPLLSIIAWFILTTGGTYNKYIIATVSLAVGLISDNIINRLINFADTSFKNKSNL
jgi:hypothetical protein